MRERLVCAVTLGALVLASSPALCAGDTTCASGPAQLQLRRLAINHMKSDQMLNDMADLDGADLSLSQVETLKRSDETVSCRAILTLRVMYGAGLRRTIDNNVTYDLLRHGEDRHLAVKINKFATVF